MSTPNLNVVLADMVRQSLANGQPAWLTVVSGSMRPLLAVDDEVLVEPIQLAQLQWGDVVLLRGEKGLLTHRFYGAIDSRLHTRGDRNLLPDPPATAEQLLGRVIARRRHGRLWDWHTPPRQWRLRAIGRIAAGEGRLLPHEVNLYGRVIHRMAWLLQTLITPR